MSELNDFFVRQSEAGYNPTSVDNNILKNALLIEDSPFVLERLIYAYSYNFEFDSDIFAIIKKYICETPVPGLSAVCLKSAIRHWHRIEDIKHCVLSFLHPDLWDDFYDEIIFLVNHYFTYDLPLESKIRESLDDLLFWAEANNVTELVSLGKRV
jgi:hypothetical protein